MAEIEDLKNKFQGLQATIKNDMTDALDKRGVGGSEFHTNSILAAIKQSKRAMLQRIHHSQPRLGSSEDDTAEFLIENEDAALATVYEGINEEELQNDGPIQDASRALVNTRTRTIQDALLSSRRLRMGYHHGCLQVLPPKWQFPKMTIKQLVDNWYIGNKKESIPPLKLLEPLHVQHLGTQANKNAGRVK